MGKYLVALLLLTLSVGAEPVARIQAIDGALNLFYKERLNEPEYRAHLEMDTRLGNLLRTDRESLATLRFFLGGLANIDKGTEIAIVSERDIEVLTRTIKVKKGNFWARFDKQKAPVRIQTAGGAMGIRGTEFVVQVDAEGRTVISVLEGRVEVFPVVGEVAMAGPGTEVRMGPESQLEVLAKTVVELEDRLARECPQLYQLREILRDTRELHEDLRETNFTVAATSREVNLTYRRVQAGLLGQKDSGGPMDTGAGTGRADELLAALESKMKDTENKTAGGAGVAGGGPTFQWEGLSAKRYALMVLDEQDDSQIYWLDYTDKTSYRYPADAKPLAPGTYRYRVVPLDAQGRHQGEAVESTFVVELP